MYGCDVQKRSAFASGADGEGKDEVEMNGLRICCSIFHSSLYSTHCPDQSIVTKPMSLINVVEKRNRSRREVRNDAKIATAFHSCSSLSSLSSRPIAPPTPQTTALPQSQAS